MRIKKLTHIIPDKIYISLQYYYHFHKLLNLKNPTTFNEKIQWLKLNDHNEKYIKIVDKCSAKEYVRNIIGEQYIIPTFGIFDKFEDINFNTLPDQFVMKCNHDSGSVVICKNKKEFDIAKAKKTINKGLNENGYWYGREWPYKNIKPKIIVEQYLSNDNSNSELTDYKFYCFDGYVDCVMTCLDRHTDETKFYFFDKDYNLKRINKRGKSAPKDFRMEKPKCLEEMFYIAHTLSIGFPFVRVDLYQCNNKVYFGELTLYPSSGFDENYLPETDIYFGSMLQLPNKK